MSAVPPPAPGSAADRSTVCLGCGLELPPRLLSCPRCRRLAHATTLADLARRAEAAAVTDRPAALALWREALELLPADSKQHQQVAGKIEALGHAGPGVQPAAHAPSQRGRAGWLAGLGLVGLFLWKFKFILLFAATKLKFLLLGFTKIGTVLSALAAFGVYWTLWGWKFALGFVLSIYIHEMGHVAALRSYGIPASAPMFIPGLGAFIRLKQNPANPREDARTGLAGPLWGLGAALVAWLVGAATGDRLWLALANAGALINLFNLIPIGPLDGGRGFRALARRQRWWICAVIGGAMVLSGENLLILLLVAAIVQAVRRDAPAEGDRGSFLLFAAIVAALVVVLKSTALVGVMGAR